MTNGGVESRTVLLALNMLPIDRSCPGDIMLIVTTFDFVISNKCPVVAEDFIAVLSFKVEDSQPVPILQIRSRQQLEILGVAIQRQ